MNNLITSLKYFAFITAELTVLFIGISAIVALVLMYISEDKLRLWLARRGAAGNVLGAVAGSLTPFCACSTIPMTLGFLNAGVPFGSVMSFVIASPLLNPIIIGMIAVLMGVKACLIYFAVSLFETSPAGQTGSLPFQFLLKIHVNPESCNFYPFSPLMACLMLYNR